ncbi:hypothetical protein [Kitasatospora sp. NPDC087315]|uniref:hypothetical protein n=1 Tax=Kitasatospora sp. NPDC087315 TaxID=3364069 RepID=UPI0037F3469F
MITESAAGMWNRAPDDLLLDIGHRFRRVEPRRRMRDRMRGLPAPVGRKSSRQLAEHAGAQRDADEIRDDLRSFVAVRRFGGGVRAARAAGAATSGLSHAADRTLQRHTVVLAREAEMVLPQMRRDGAGLASNGKPWQRVDI